MKKYALCAAAVIACGCAKMSNTELYTPDEMLRTTGDVTLCLSIEDLSTKLSADDNGHFLFAPADSVMVACSDGSYVKFRLAGTGETKRAFFSGEIPAGKTLGSHVVYPCGAVGSFSGSELTVKLEDTQVYGGDYPCPMVGAIGTENYFVKMCQLCSFVKISIASFPAGVASVEFKDAGGKTLSGEYGFNLETLGTKGLTAKEGNGAVRFEMTSSPSEATFAIPCAAGDYNDITFTLKDEGGKEMGTQSVSSFPLSFARGKLSRVETSSEIKVKAKQVVVDGKESFNLSEVSAGVYEAVVDVTASSTIELNIDSQLYGIASYSGAGGVGYCKSANSALPYYNFTASHTQFYYVSKAIGELAPIEGANDIWVNLDTPGKVKVVYDSNYGTSGSCYVEIVKDSDPAVLLDEQFDLCTCGGDVVWVLQGSLYGSDPASYDGISASTPKKANWNASGSKNVMFDYPTAAGSAVASSSYMKSRGLQDWTFARVDERPGGMQLNQGSGFDSYCITPKLSGISGTRNITVRMEISRYSSTSADPIYVEITGGGEFASAHVDQTIGEAFQSMFPNWASQLSCDYPSLSGSKFTIGTDYCVCVPTSGNTVIYKPTSTYTFNVTGATSSTQIKVQAPCVASNAPRCVLYGIKITE